MNRSRELQSFLDDVTQSVFGRVGEAGQCVCCGESVFVETDFRDALSVKEYGISGLCQTCQDDIFGF